jgi:hypothetical protein
MSYEIHPLVAAGIFGVTNIGMAMPSEREVQAAVSIVNDTRWGRTCTPGTMTEYFAQQYIENDDHFEMFTGEIASWYERFKSGGTAEIQNTWPEHWALYQRAMNTLETV